MFHNSFNIFGRGEALEHFIYYYFLRKNKYNKVCVASAKIPSQYF